MGYQQAQQYSQEPELLLGHLPHQVCSLFATCPRGHVLQVPDTWLLPVMYAVRAVQGLHAKGAKPSSAATVTR